MLSRPHTVVYAEGAVIRMRFTNIFILEEEIFHRLIASSSLVL